ncbi:MAG: sulfite exporter TauE/SafE family protein [Candidatus Eiseniibacteriota bacterium]
MTRRAILVGIAGGLSSGLLGIGGGTVMVPLLTHFLHLEQRRAQGTSLAILIFTALAAALTYRAAGPVDLVRAGWLALGAVAAAALGAQATARFSNAALQRAFGAFMILVGLRLFLTGIPEGAWLDRPGPVGIAWDLATGFVVGWLSGFLGVGGGVVLVPILTLLFGLPQIEAQGVSLFMIIPTSIVGAWSHWRLGNVERRIVLPTALASIGAAVAGAAIANRLPGTMLRVLFAIALVLVGVRYLARPSQRARNEKGPAERRSPS